MVKMLKWQNNLYMAFSSGVVEANAFEALVGWNGKHHRLTLALSHIHTFSPRVFIFALCHATMLYALHLMTEFVATIAMPFRWLFPLISGWRFHLVFFSFKCTFEIHLLNRFHAVRQRHIRMMVVMVEARISMGSILFDVRCTCHIY